MPQHIVTETINQYVRRKDEWRMFRWCLMIFGIIFVLGGIIEFKFSWIIWGAIAFIIGYFFSKREWARARRRRAKDELP